MLRTNNDDRVIITTDSDISSSLRTQAGDGGTLCSHNPGEARAVCEGQEADMTGFRRVFDSVVDHLLCLGQRSFIAGLQGPHGIALLDILVVLNDLPLEFGNSFLGIVVDASGRGAIGGRAGGQGGLAGLDGLVDLDPVTAEGTEELPLVGDGINILQGNSDLLGDTSGGGGLNLRLET